jgi:hypothetical protein
LLLRVAYFGQYLPSGAEIFTVLEAKTLFVASTPTIVVGICS